MKRLTPVVASIGFLVLGNAACAGSLTVSPVTLDIVTAREAASSITITNAGAAPVHVQIRAMRWTQPLGKDQLGPTEDVAVSPPIVEVQPGAEQVIRVVRISQQPVVGEEAYRLLVDELPTSARAPSANVNFVVRQSLPVFFRSPTATVDPLAFELARSGAALSAVGINRGDVHQKITLLAIRDAGGAVHYSKSGLVGYVLGRSSFSWKLPAMFSGPASIEGRTERGPIKLTVTPK